MPFKFADRWQSSLKDVVKGDNADDLRNLLELRDQQFEDWMDRNFASGEYTPTLTNVTGGNPGGFYTVLAGQVLVFHADVGTGGQATAIGTIGISLPPGFVARTGTTQRVHGSNAATVVAARVLSGTTTCTVGADVLNANFAALAGVASVRVSGAILIDPL